MIYGVPIGLTQDQIEGKPASFLPEWLPVVFPGFDPMKKKQDENGIVLGY